MHLPYVVTASLDNQNFLVKLELLLDEECWWSTGSLEQSQSVLIVPQAGIVVEILSYLEFPHAEILLKVILILIIQ